MEEGTLDDGYVAPEVSYVRHARAEVRFIMLEDGERVLQQQYEDGWGNLHWVDVPVWTKPLRSSIAEGRKAMSDTVTVPRWALDYVLQFAGRDTADTYKWISACHALERALDTKNEMPDEPGHSPLATSSVLTAKETADYYRRYPRDGSGYPHPWTRALDTKTEIPDESGQ